MLRSEGASRLRLAGGRGEFEECIIFAALTYGGVFCSSVVSKDERSFKERGRDREPIAFPSSAPSVVDSEDLLIKKRTA
mgnify:CR=1 FL=1